MGCLRDGVTTISRLRTARYAARSAEGLTAWCRRRRSDDER
jgi:hypothetical protein